MELCVYVCIDYLVQYHVTIVYERGASLTVVVLGRGTRRTCGTVSRGRVTCRLGEPLFESRVM